MRLYLNGDEIGHAAAEASNTTTSANPLRLGLNTNVNGDKLHGMNGLMDEFKFYCVPLGAEQIKAEAQQTEYLPIAGGKLLAYDKALGGALEIMMLYNGFMLKGVSVGKNGLGEDDFETGFNVLTLAEKYMNSLTAGTYPVVLTLVKGDIIQTLTLSLQVFGTISEPVHDFSRELLTAVYNAYIGMDTSAYTKASTDALKTALSKANEMMQKEDASESEMQRAAANVMKAAAALEMDTTDLEETIEAAKAAAAAAQKVADEAIKAASANAAAASDAKKLAEEAKKAAEEASAAAEKAAQEASKKAEAAQKAADEAKAKYEEEAEKSAAARTEMERLKEQAAEAQRMAEAAQRVAEEARKAAQNTVIRTEFMSARVSLRSVKNSQKRSARVLWRRVKGAEGYVIQYASNSKFKGVKNVTVKKAGAAQKTIKKLKSGKKYYVRVKAYRMVEGKKIFTKYSYKKSVKIK